MYDFAIRDNIVRKCLGHFRVHLGYIQFNNASCYAWCAPIPTAAISDISGIFYAGLSIYGPI